MKDDIKNIESILEMEFTSSLEEQEELMDDIGDALEQDEELRGQLADLWF